MMVVKISLVVEFARVNCIICYLLTDDDQKLRVYISHIFGQTLKKAKGKEIGGTAHKEAKASLKKGLEK